MAKRYILTVVISVSAIAIYLALPVPDGPLTGEWSTATDGIATALHVEDALLPKGATEQVFALFRNDGKAKAKLAATTYMTINIYHRGMPLGEMIGDPEFFRNPTELDPGEVISMPVSWIQGDRDGPGTYRFDGNISSATMGYVFHPLKVRVSWF